jgi:putative RNA 2'-phosphotransferase
MSISREELDLVVWNCDKQRFAFDVTGSRIRANEGHSTAVDLELVPVEPPVELHHGTARRFLEPILREGLRKMARHHVHLSADTGTARRVGSRHGEPVVLVVAAAAMHQDRHLFFRAANGVWLVEHVPPRYLRLLTPET